MKSLVFPTWIRVLAECWQRAPAQKRRWQLERVELRHTDVFHKLTWLDSGAPLWKSTHFQPGPPNWASDVAIAAAIFARRPGWTPAPYQKLGPAGPKVGPCGAARVQRGNEIDAGAVEGSMIPTPGCAAAPARRACHKMYKSPGER